MHCILRVEGSKGSKINAATKISENFENGGDLRRLIENETEFQIIVEEFRELQSICLEAYGRRTYCRLTIEMASEQEQLIPRTTIRVPRTAEVELMKFLLHVKEFFRSQMQDFLSEEKGDMDIQRAYYKIPAFFKGDIDEVVMC